MLIDLIQERIQFAKSVKNWQDAIRMAAAPLLEGGYINKNYIDKMIENVKENGTYIIIVPGFAMPHTRPENGALKTGMAFLGLEEPVEFPENNNVKVLVAMAATDANAHIDAMTELTDVLIDDNRLEELFEYKDAAKVKELMTV